MHRSQRVAPPAAAGLALAWLVLATVTARAGDKPAAGPGDSPAPQPRPAWLDPGACADWLRQAAAGVKRLEIVEMLSAVAGGSQMGPGEGWFHPGQSRYGWEWLAGRFDADGDGTISRKEFGEPAELFERLDRNGDGVLTADDFDWSERSPFLRQSGMAAQWFRLLDGDSNGRVSRAEWEAFFARAAGAKGYVTPEDLRKALFPPTPAKAAKGKEGGPSPAVLLKGLLTGELGSPFHGPRVGQRAPDFTLATHDGKREVTLSSFRGRKPVVLVFGSFT